MQEKYLKDIVESIWIKEENNEHLIFNKISYQLKDYFKDFKTKRDLIKLLGLSRINYSLNKSLFLIRFYLVENNEIKYIPLNEVIGNDNKNINFDLVKLKLTKQSKTFNNNIETTAKVNDSYTVLPIRKKAYNYYLKRNNSYTGILFRLTDYTWYIPYTRNNKHNYNPPYIDYSLYVSCIEMITKKTTPKNNLLERTIVKMLEML